MNARRNRIKLVLLALLFFAPLVGAALVYFIAPQWIPEGRVNYGRLIEPAQTVPAMTWRDAAKKPLPAALLGKWSLVQLGGAQCDAACEERLVLTRQVRLALNQNRGRVQRIYVAPDAGALETARLLLAAAHPDLVLVADGGAPGARAGDFFSAEDPHALFLVDPAGRWLMLYAGPIEPRGLHKDLKRLLRFSQIG